MHGNHSLAPEAKPTTPPPPPQEKKADATQGQDKTGETKGEAAQAKARDVGIEDVLWSDDGTKGVAVLRSADNKDRWIEALDQDTGKTRILVTQHDDA